MSDDNHSPTATDSNNLRPRRGSFTTNTFGNIFGRNGAGPNSTAGTPSLPMPISTTTPGRRMSITTLGLLGTSPSQTSALFPAGRRTSISTANSDSIDESAVEDDEGLGRSLPHTPHGRRMSFGAQSLLNPRPGNGNPGAPGRAPSYNHSSNLASVKGTEGARASTQASMQSKPRTTSDFSSKRSGEGLNWSEQFRSRAESVVSRPSFGHSPPNQTPRSPTAMAHERAKSVSDMPAPPHASIPAPSIIKEDSALRRKPDAVGERMLRGEFHMD
ncbi:MAG: hypothetical protein M1818_000980 [Claussenomyces sp. TS43310]|nr:MAG: hypothetical protein M1818_000980 [Claussenomyces sp. TS43310]